MTGPLLILDDDPTGTQAIADVPVALRWDHGEVGRALRRTDRAIHVLTNSRAHPPADAAAVTADAARCALRDVPSGRVIMRGDSTLRGHVWEEYEAVRGIVSPQGWPPLLLVPALPAAGRVTRLGVHLLQRDGEEIPLHETEYATDGEFGYADARLAAWAHERSGGQFATGDAVETGPDGVAEALARAARCGRPAVVVPDAATIADLEEIARGLRRAWADGIDALVRCAPTFAAVLAGTLATGHARPGAVGDALVVCGSFVPNTTVQLATLERRRPGLQVEIDVAALGAGTAAADAALARAARRARVLLADRGCAVVATSRERLAELVPTDRQRAVAERLASIVRRVGEHERGFVVGKGGITCAVTASAGMGARTARVVGPILDGVALWQLDSGARFVVVPGNVGGPGLLADLLDLLAPESHRG